MTNGESAHESASGFDQPAYGDQLFDPSTLVSEYERRSRLLGEFIATEAGAFYVHQAVTQELAKRDGPPHEAPSNGGVNRLYRQINYDPEPGNSEKRRWLQLGLHVTSKGLEIPLLSVSHAPSTDCPDIPKPKKYVRGEIVLVHQLLQNAPGNMGSRSMFDAFMGQAPDSDWVQERVMKQRTYVGWLRIAAEQVGIPRMFKPYRPIQDKTSPN